jgi:hypothetical protein
VPRSRKRGGVIQFSGRYRDGSAGSDDALFIEWRIREFCSLPDDRSPSGLIVDLRELHYEWGDDLHVSSFTLEREIPLRVLLTPSQIKAYQPVVYAHEVRTDPVQAWQEVNAAILSPREA